MRPTVERPLLIGILVDVSGSMMSSIKNETGATVSRLESFRDSLEDLVKKASILSKTDSKEKIAPLIKIFSYGFGFGGLLSAIFGSKGPKVRDLLDTNFSTNSTVGIDELANNWQDYKRHIESLARNMLGDTPMGEGFEKILMRFEQELGKDKYAPEPILFVLSDGEPTDSSNFEIIKLAKEVKKIGVIVISCFVTDQNITKPRTLYSYSPSDWPEGAKLMLECSSPLPENSSFTSYLKEFNWAFENDGKLFTQINQSEVLSEFMQMVLSPLEEEKKSIGTSEFKVFVSYSHQDSKYLNKGSLIDYLSGLEREGINFWYDKRILAGEDWDDEIKTNIAEADVALVLVSQSFLNSRYCIDEEVERFINNRIAKGLVIFPVILSHCDWKSHDWLSDTQFEPRDGLTIELDYDNKGKRDQLFLSIYQQLREIKKRKNIA